MDGGGVGYGVGGNLVRAAVPPPVDGHPGDGAARDLLAERQAHAGQLGEHEHGLGGGGRIGAAGKLVVRLAADLVTGRQDGGVGGAAQLLGLAGDVGGQVPADGRVRGVISAASPGPPPWPAACRACMPA